MQCVKNKSQRHTVMQVHLHPVPHTHQKHTRALTQEKNIARTKKFIEHMNKNKMLLNRIFKNHFDKKYI